MHHRTKYYQVLASEIEYENPYMRVRKDLITLPNEETKPYYVLERGEFSIIIPLTAANKTYLVGQYRHPIKRFSWEFPMGYVPEKTPLEMAKLELKQETGLSAAEWEEIGSFYLAGGHSEQKAHVFIAQDLTAGAPQFERHEFLEIRPQVELGEIAQMIAEGEITDGPTIAAYYYLAGYLKKGHTGLA